MMTFNIKERSGGSIYPAGEENVSFASGKLMKK
jgi:hypothetical protein